MNAQDIINKIVTVTVDRPLGSYHPQYTNLKYLVNYGYIDGVMGGDGEEQDAYILGVSQPLTKFTGKVIAIIYRENDNETKWIVSPTDKNFTNEEIINLTSFQEKYFKIRIIR